LYIIDVIIKQLNNQKGDEMEVEKIKGGKTLCPNCGELLCESMKARESSAHLATFTLNLDSQGDLMYNKNQDLYNHEWNQPFMFFCGSCDTELDIEEDQAREIKKEE
jgi:hypothetical protein